MSDLSGTWFLYRHSLTPDKPVLEKSDTLLDVISKDNGYEMVFDVVDTPGATHARTLMTMDPISLSYQGGVGRYDFRVHEIGTIGNILIGHAFDRTHQEQRDFFCGIRMRRIEPLPDVIEETELGGYVLPLDRKPIEKADFTLDTRYGLIKSNVKEYQIEPLRPRHPKGGQEFKAWSTEGEDQIELGGWILPYGSDGSDGSEKTLIVAGYWHDWGMMSKHSEKEGGPISKPGDPHCTRAWFGVQ